MEQTILRLVNQFFELGKKMKQKEDASYERQMGRLAETFIEMGYEFHDPHMEAYNDTRTDCEASISGNGKGTLYISEVIKPLVIRNEEGRKTIIQKAVVIVESA
ncbi:MAG: hypothetical protein IAF38_05415 [Bacteroidia bacterium]|nr:hypothetical protein [Bacteroidia bacterium]